MGKGRSEHQDKVTSDRNAAQGEDLALVSEELGSVVNNALADGLKVLDFAVAEIRQEELQPVDVLVLPRLVKLAVSAELEEDLVILSIVHPPCQRSLCKSSQEQEHLALGYTYPVLSYPRNAETRTLCPSSSSY